MGSDNLREILKNRKGFSLVELLAVVVILGLLAAIGIGATNNLIDKAKKDEMDSLKNTVTMSAQSYMQNNKNLAPKIFGESTVIKVSDLKASNYLTENIKNSKDESCMEKSFVKVYKISNSEYQYVPFIICGSEEVPVEESVPEPIITAKFSDSSGQSLDEKLKNVSDGYLFIEMNAASEEQMNDYNSQNMDLFIEGYTFKIFVYKGSVKNEAYNSGALSGGKQEKIVINKKLDNYIDVTGVTQVALEVLAINNIGGVTVINTTVGESGDVDVSTYNDDVPPQCVKPDNPYTEGDWLNKNEYNTTKLQRKLTVGCYDGTGSGCIRNYFTMSWPNDDDKYGAEYVFIEVKDNAGNISEHNDDCKFRVNVDIKTPDATVTAYVGGSSSSNDSSALQSKITGSNILTKTTKASNSKPSVSIASSDYDKLIANSTDAEWMNKENYPNGIIYKIELTDNIRLDKWAWNTNPGYVNSTKSGNYKSVNGSNPEAFSGSIVQDAAHGATEFHGSTHDVIYVRFLTEGMRYGVFTAYDKAGNKIEIKIAANLDRTAPPVPNSLVAYVYNKVRTGGTSVSGTGYSFGTWTNKYVQVQTTGGQNRDNLSNNTSLSGFWQFRYYAQNNAGTRVGSGNYSTYTSGKGVYDFKGSAAQVDGINKIKFMGCDKAGNCSDWGTQKEVWIDITVPTCTVKKHLSGTESDYGWLGIGETATVRATCNDPTSTLASGCTVGSFEHLYNYQINTTTAGAKGNGKAGSFTDYAGNTVNCTATETVRTDYKAPTCSVSGGSSAWTNKSRTVKATCSDTGGSKCVKSTMSHTYSTNTNSTSGGAKGLGKGGTFYDKADNSVDCPANQTVKVDVVNPYNVWDNPPGTYDSNTGITVTVKCQDDFSGVSDTYSYQKPWVVKISSPTASRKLGLCCKDMAGNTVCPSHGPWTVRYYSRDDSCDPEEYKTCATYNCGSFTHTVPRGQAFNTASCPKYQMTLSTSLGDQYKCAKTCANKACGVKTYEYCWHT